MDQLRQDMLNALDDEAPYMRIYQMLLGRAKDDLETASGTIAVETTVTMLEEDFRSLEIKVPSKFVDIDTYSTHQQVVYVNRIFLNKFLEVKGSKGGKMDGCDTNEKETPMSASLSRFSNILFSATYVSVI